MDIWVAPRDLSDATEELLTCRDSFTAIAGLKGWQGHDGAPIEDRPQNAPDVSYEEALRRHLLAAWQSGAKSTGWFMGFQELMNGKTDIATTVLPNNLLAHHDQLPEESKLATIPLISDEAHCYWSCTEAMQHVPELVKVTEFPDGFTGTKIKDFYGMSARPFRAEFRLQLC